MIDDVLLRFAIMDLYAAYAACLDGGRFDEWPDFFTEDADYQLIPRENHDAGLPLATIALEGQKMLRDRVYGVTDTLFHAPYYQRHIIGLPVLRNDGHDSVEAETNYLLIRTKRDELSEIFNAGRYIDHIVRTDDGLRFARKICVFDSELIPNSIIYPV